MYEYTFTRKRVNDVQPRITQPKEVVAALGPVFDGAERELLVVVALDSRNGIVGYETVYQGNVSAALVRVGELFKFPVRVIAKSIIILHNHPSGDTLPSPDDLLLTTEVKKAGDILDIKLLDHIIVGRYRDFTSLKDRGDIR